MTTTATTTTTTTTTPATTPEIAAATYSPYLILIVCLILALIGFLVGRRWLARRRHRHEAQHLVADIAEPETLDDLKR
jgi:hypothetical protein